MTQKKFTQKHPYYFVVFLQVIIILVTLFAGAITFKLELNHYFLYGISLGLLTLIVVGLLSKMGWWDMIGFRKVSNPKLLWLLCVPVLTVASIFYTGNFQIVGISKIVVLLFITLMSGFFEEACYRGLMLQVLLPKGPWKAVLLSSVLFSLAHGMNLLAGWDLLRVLMQLCYSFAIGFGYAAFILRTGVIWPIMIIHFVNNFLSLIKLDSITRAPGSDFLIYETVFFTIVFLVYGFLVIRSYIRNPPDND